MGTLLREGFSQLTVKMKLDEEMYSVELLESGVLKYTFFKDGEEFKAVTKRISEYEELPDFVEQVSLKEFLPAHYRIRVALIVQNREILFETEEFDVTHARSIARPWIYSQLLSQEF